MQKTSSQTQSCDFNWNHSKILSSQLYCLITTFKRQKGEQELLSEEASQSKIKVGLIRQVAIDGQLFSPAEDKLTLASRVTYSNRGYIQRESHLRGDRFIIPLQGDSLATLTRVTLVTQTLFQAQGTSSNRYCKSISSLCTPFSTRMIFRCF